MVKNKEIWKDILGYKGLYKVSNLGRVKSIYYEKTHRILSACPNNGYLYVGLWSIGKCKKHSIHRLVAEAFLPNPENKPCVNHLNAKRDDNTLANLEWCTHSENNRYAYHSSGRINPMMGVTGRNNKRSRPVLQLSKTNNSLISRYVSISEASEKTGVSAGNIVSCCKGILKSAGCFMWKYEN